MTVDPTYAARRSATKGLKMTNCETLGQRPWSRRESSAHGRTGPRRPRAKKAHGGLGRRSLDRDLRLWPTKCRDSSRSHARQSRIPSRCQREPTFGRKCQTPEGGKQRVLAPNCGEASQGPDLGLLNIAQGTRPTVASELFDHFLTRLVVSLSSPLPPAESGCRVTSPSSLCIIFLAFGCKTAFR